MSREYAKRKRREELKLRHLELGRKRQKRPQKKNEQMGGQRAKEIVDLMIQIMNAGSVDYCCQPVDEETCCLLLGHEGPCKPYQP